jgi:ferric-dicitrate binding protein FerR (iron transport regulator)
MKATIVNIDLIVKFLQGEASVDEKQELLGWVGENYANKKLYMQMKDIWEATQASTDDRFESQKAWEKLKQQIEEKLEENQRQKNRILWLNVLKVAAIVIITFGITLIGFNFSSKSDNLLAKCEINVPLR